MACAPSGTPIVCACFVVACFKFMPSVSATSCITWETRTLPLSFITSVGKWACLVIMSIMTFAVFTAVELETRSANAYLKRTSIAVMILS